jgi:hypothetical protein
MRDHHSRPRELWPFAIAATGLLAVLGAAGAV